MRITLCLTHRCNLNCRYCYAGHTYNLDMPVEMGRRIIDYAIEVQPRGQQLQFFFFGGEPLICIDAMQALACYMREQAECRSIDLSIGLTTNGTILNSSILRMLSDYQIDLCISVDGLPQAHDLNRRFVNGRGTHPVVMHNLRYALHELSHVQVNTVYSPDTIDSLYEGVCMLLGAGVTSIHLNPNILGRWSPKDEPSIRKAFAAIANAYVAAYENGREISISVLDAKMLLFLKGGYSIKDMCCMGDGELAFAPSGNVYPCERFIDEDRDSRYCLGNIATGIDIARRCSLRERRGNRNPECRSCGWRRYCMNWCGCTNAAMTGATDLAGPALCAIERATIESAQSIFSRLSEDENELFREHCLRGVLQH